MELVDLKEDIKQIAYMLKRMLNADVIAVDRHLNSLINTFEYEKKPIDIQINSVVGSVIVSGEMKIVEDKSCFEECVNCPQFEECEIASIVGVPIITYQGCIGVIALLIRKRKDYRLEWTFEDAVVFLEKIAEMLGNKIQNCMYIQKIENIPSLMHSVLNYMPEAAAAVDDQKRILFYNQRFEDFFGTGRPMTGCRIAEVLEHRTTVKPLKDQTYGNGAEFQKYSDGITELALVQKIENADRQEMYLYVFRDISMDVVRKKQAKTYKAKEYIEEFFGAGAEAEEAKTAAGQAVNNDLSILIEGDEKAFNDELARMYLMKYADDGKGILEVECTRGERILEQELFGASSRFRGFMDMARGKAICLYSIEYLPLYLQKRLVEFLMKNQVRGQYGSSIRVIVTTEKDLKELSEKGLFSDKLYYYVSRNQIQIPPAEEYKEVMQHCLKKYIEHYSKVYQHQGVKVKEDVWDYLSSCRWEEGLLSLRRFAELLMMELSTSIVTVGMVKKVQFKYGYKRMGGIENEKEEQIRELLMYSGKTKKEIAEELGVGRATLYRWLKKYNL